nr:MAG TPA: hypothetical protein [Caudoviricetes sp.]
MLSHGFLSILLTISCKFGIYFHLHPNCLGAYHSWGYFILYFLTKQKAQVQSLCSTVTKPF